MNNSPKTIEVLEHEFYANKHLSNVLTQIMEMDLTGKDQLQVLLESRNIVIAEMRQLAGGEK